MCGGRGGGGMVEGGGSKTFANMIGFPSITRDEIPVLKYLR